MKKLVNGPDNYVAETLEGFQLAYSHLVRLHEGPWVGRATPKPDARVAIVSGGGSGHEPLHLGFVGFGMLDAAVPGPVFTAPTPRPVVAAATAVDSGAGVLFVVKNYTGDVLNFEVAAELAAERGITTRTVVVADDCGVGGNIPRRGVAGTVLVEKIAGAAAERGDNLDAVTQVATRAVNNVSTMGVALRPGTVPHLREPTFTLPEDQVELGIGIHGEPGRRQVPAANADQLIAELYRHVRDDLHLQAAERVIFMVNGMGGTPPAELWLVNRQVHALLAADKIVAARNLVGTFVTSMEMAGVSLTLMRIDDELLALYDAPALTPSWPVTGWGTQLGPEVP